MMATIRISIRGNPLAVDSGLLGIHKIANRGSEANGCQIGIDILFGGWIEPSHGTALRCWSHDGCDVVVCLGIEDS